MKSDKFRQYSELISSKSFKAMALILILVIIQYISVSYLYVKVDSFPLCKPKISEWLIVSFEVGFIFALLFFHHFMLRQKVLSNYMLKMYNDPLPENTPLDIDTYVFLRLFAYINIISVFKMIIAYFPSLIASIAYICGFSKGNFTTFTFLSIALIVTSYPSKTLKENLISILDYTQKGK